MASKNSGISPERQKNESRSSKHLSRRIFQNFVLAWLDPNIGDFDDDLQNFVTQGQRIIGTVESFYDPDEFVDFLTDIKDEKIFLILSDALDQKLIPLIHNIPQLHSIYILRKQSTEDGLCKTEWRKVKGAFSQIELICKVLEQDAKQYDHNSLPISIVAPGDYSKTDLNQLPAAFMYSQIFKEILIDIQHKDDAKEDLVHFWYEQYSDNESQLKIIGEFERTYIPSSAVRWYTRENFTYSILNRALRTMDIEIIIKMGFFLRDLYRQIEQLYVQQSPNRAPLTVYRGQGVFNNDFAQLRKSAGGLLSFNYFLSTSTDREVSMLFCPIPPQDPDVIPVLFKIQIDPTLACTPFASLNDNSVFNDEEEILFSMHTVFRIVQVVQVNDYWQVELTSTSDNDRELKEITNCIREELLGRTGWHRLAHLIFKIGNFDKAEEIYRTLLEQTPEYDINELYFIYSQLGLMKHFQGDRIEAAKLYQKSHEYGQRSPFSNHLCSAAMYNNVASVHLDNAEYEKALAIYHKTRQMEEELLSADHLDLATTYNNIAMVHKRVGEYNEALIFYQKAFEIYRKSLPLNHPDLALIHNNIGVIYYELGEYSKSLEFLQEALKIGQKSLDCHHPNLATTCCAIGLLYKTKKEYSKGLEFYEKALRIYQEFLPPNHSNWAVVYSNIASLYLSQGEDRKALEFAHKALTIEQNSLPPDHPELAATYSNIGAIYIQTREHSMALEWLFKALAIHEKSAFRFHPRVATTYNNIAIVYYAIAQYPKALDFFKRTLTTLQRIFPTNHPEIQQCQANIAQTRRQM